MAFVVFSDRKFDYIPSTNKKTGPGAYNPSKKIKGNHITNPIQPFNSSMSRFEKTKQANEDILTQEVMTGINIQEVEMAKSIIQKNVNQQKTSFSFSSKIDRFKTKTFQKPDPGN